ncbi:uncharacterized protein LOC141909025 [Tubulanus polymorphus]|uniref:uncharacterized protein LOC141909025 n=1 Tax=Tubulanus polymorphus TaxID=672921 RepID=UPI003DA21592
MVCDLPCMSYMALYIISMHVIHSNSRTSTHWKLSDGRVVQAMPPDSTQDHHHHHHMAADQSLLRDEETGVGSETDPDPLLGILTTNKVLFNGGWKLEARAAGGEGGTGGATSSDSSTCIQQQYDNTPRVTSTNQNNIVKAETIKGTSPKKDLAPSNSKNSAVDKNNLTRQKPTDIKHKKETLDCGKAVNSTPFDHLRGITNRKDHPHIPEPEVAMIFRKKGSRNSEIDMTELEKRLRKNRKERPKSAQVYNQIGNFWRIKGNTQLSIECFRKALSISPNNPDVLLNLARVLFNLQYLDDAIFLTRRSLEMQPPDQNPWLQHFTLGEILKAYGHYQEATHHFRHTLELKAGFQPAQAHLREMEVNPDGTVTYYTLFIILFLVMVVLCGILTTVEANIEEYGEMMKTQRHFNRAMAMRSIKLGMNTRLMRMKKYPHT